MDDMFLEMFYDKASGGVVFIPCQKLKSAEEDDKKNIIDISSTAKVKKQN